MNFQDYHRSSSKLGRFGKIVGIDTEGRKYLVVLDNHECLAGPIVVTIANHVPLKDLLAAVDTHGRDATRRWDRYLAGWNDWNRVSAAAGLGAAVLMTIGLRLG